MNKAADVERTLEQEMRELLDKNEIREVLMRYSRAIDRKNHDVLTETIYWPDAEDDHIEYKGDVPGFVDYVKKLTRHMVTAHFLGNMLIEMQDPTHAFVETYNIGFHDIALKSGEHQDMIGVGRYLDNVEKRGREWRIKKRVVALDFFTRNPSTSDWSAFEGIQSRGTAWPNDILYRLHPEGQKA